jgi:hypothetical protein
MVGKGESNAEQLVLVAWLRVSICVVATRDVEDAIFFVVHRIWDDNDNIVPPDAEINKKESKNNNSKRKKN